MKRRVSYLCTNGGLWHWLGWLWWGTTILPLACCNIKCVASSFQQSLMLKKKILNMQYKPSSSSIQRWHVFTFQSSKSVFTCPNQFACNPWTETPFLLWFWLHLVLYWFLTLWSLVSLSACTSSSRHKERHFCSGEREEKKILSMYSFVSTSSGQFLVMCSPQIE